MKRSQVGIQLFTLRNHCRTAEDYARTLKRVKAIGYSAIQISAVGPIPVEELRSIAEGEGLVIAATHEPSKTILAEPEAVIEKLEKLGTSITAYPSPVEVDFSNDAQVEAWIARLEAVAQQLAQAGKILAYHNHAIEFLHWRGRPVLEAVYEGAPNIQGEPDTYWIQHGGGNPVEWCQRLKGRLPIIHLKDYAMTYNEAGKSVPTYTEIGNGNLDFKAIIAAAEASGCQWYVVEQDTCPGDPFESIAQSFRYIEENLLST